MNIRLQQVVLGLSPLAVVALLLGCSSDVVQRAEPGAAGGGGGVGGSDGGASGVGGSGGGGECSGCRALYLQQAVGPPCDGAAEALAALTSCRCQTCAGACADVTYCGGAGQPTGACYDCLFSLATCLSELSTCTNDKR